MNFGSEEATRAADDAVNLAQDERHGFANRLRQALHSAGYPNARVSEVARQYRARSPHEVTNHAVRKWLDGDSLPRQHHVICLATWLDCDPGWLRYGRASSEPPKVRKVSHVEAVMLNDLAILSSSEKKLVRKLVDLLASVPR